MSIVWDQDERVWIDDDTGKALTVAQLITMRDALADDYAARFAELAQILSSGTITVAEWKVAFDALLLEAIAHGYTFGRGGIDAMTITDWERVATIVKEQGEYVDGFAADIEAKIKEKVTEALNPPPAPSPEPTVPGTTPSGPAPDDVPSVAPKKPLIVEAPIPTVDEATEAAVKEIGPYVENRSELYAGNVVHGYEQGQVAAVSESIGDLILPVYPADGGTTCKSRCRCAWSIYSDEAAKVWHVSWVTEGDGNVCAGCQERARLYGALVIPFGSGGIPG